MLILKEVNKNIAFRNFKIPESAGRVILNDELFKKLCSLGNATMYEYYYDDYENNNDGRFSWIEEYSKGNYDMTENDVWGHIESVFKIYEKNPMITPVSFRYDDKKNNTVNIYIISRQYNKFWLDYTIHIVLKKVNLKKHFPKSYFINKYPRNRIPLKNILKYNKKR